MALKERKIETLVWDQKGKAVGGYLVSASRTKYQDGSTGITYVMRRIDGSVVVFKGSTNLNLAIMRSDIGCFVQIEYLGEDMTRDMKEGMNRPKLFRVQVDEERTLRPVEHDPNGITDEDVPF